MKRPMINVTPDGIPSDLNAQEPVAPPVIETAMNVAVLCMSHRAFADWLALNRQPGKNYFRVRCRQDLIGFHADRLEIVRLIGWHTLPEADEIRSELFRIQREKDARHPFVVDEAHISIDAIRNPDPTPF